MNSPQKFKTEILTGLCLEHLTSLEDGMEIHSSALESFLKLKKSASDAGFDLKVISSHRSFSAQEKIWNTKALGKRTLLDSQGIALDYEKLSKEEIMYAILRWSALPGASRHHWGTDLDVYDGNALPSKDYQVQITPEEADGIFGEFHRWLDQKIANHESFGFFRPYARDLGGVAPERWHLSYAPLSAGFQELMTPTLLEEAISQSNIELKDLVLENITEIYNRFTKKISPIK